MGWGQGSEESWGAKAYTQKGKGEGEQRGSGLKGIRECGKEAFGNYGVQLDTSKAVFWLKITGVDHVHILIGSTAGDVDKLRDDLWGQ